MTKYKISKTKNHFGNSVGQIQKTDSFPKILNEPLTTFFLSDDITVMHMLTN